MKELPDMSKEATAPEARAAIPDELARLAMQVIPGDRARFAMVDEGFGDYADIEACCSVVTFDCR